jgi:hypothetical protein
MHTDVLPNDFIGNLALGQAARIDVNVPYVLTEALS